MPDAIGRFHWIVIDTVDPARIAPFWCALLGVRERGWFGDDYLMLTTRFEPSKPEFSWLAGLATGVEKAVAEERAKLRSDPAAMQRILNDPSWVAWRSAA